jgi:hypothetical protein
MRLLEEGVVDGDGVKGSGGKGGVFLGHVCTLGDCIFSVLYQLVSLLLLIYFPVAPWPVVPSFPAHPLTLAVVVHHCYFLLGCLLRWVPSILIYTYLYLSIPIYTIYR